jgi:hypothetical protein
MMELHDLAFAVYFVFYVMVWIKVCIQRFKFGIFDCIVILIGNYLILPIYSHIDRMCAASEKRFT